MDIQKMVDNAVQAKRANEMNTSEQLTLGELILKLEGITDKELLIVFDNPKYKPTGLDSWRGSYRELAINYEDGGVCYEQPKDDCKRDEFGYHDYGCKCGGLKEHSTILPENPKVKDLLEKLQLINGKVVIGYKGGDFTMGKTTPVWVANYGTSLGFKESKKDEYSNQGIVDILTDGKVIIIKTKLLDY